MAECKCKKPEPKVVKRLADAVQIETRENGFVVKIGKRPSGDQIYFTTTGITAGFDFLRLEPTVKYEGPTNGQEYVFADFASLSAWMRENVKHGKPARK